MFAAPAKLFRKIRFVLLLVLSYSCIIAQEYPAEIKSLTQKVSSLVYANKYDSAEAMIVSYLDRPNLSPAQKFYGHYLFADFIKASGKPKDAIQRLEESKKYLSAISDRSKYESLINGNIAECYFDLMMYDNAKEFASVSIKLNPDSSLRSGGHAVNYLIIGYKDYLEKHYSYAIECYNLAIKEYQKSGETCELPLVYTKMAKAYNGMGSLSQAEKHINKAVEVSDSCNINAYRLLSKRTLFDIYKENKNFEKALALLEEINVWVEKTETEKQRQLIGEMEVKYQTRLMQNENNSLRELNQKREELVSKQRQALMITVIAILILSGLIFLLVKTNYQRKKAEHNIALLNAELERKITERTTHLKTANEQIEENAALLSYQNKQLIDFCNIISHNLRSPLVNMGMLVTFIEKTHDPDEQRLYVEKLKPVINTLNETFSELVESLQIRQDLEIKSEKILFEEYFQRTLDGLEAEVKKSKAVIEHNFNEAPHIFYPPKYLSSILHNLLSNALKYRSEQTRPHIKVESRRSNGNIILSVADNGLGIDLKKHKDNLFKIRKVFHEHPEAKGFGLYITKTQIETMGGRIWVESTPEKGSVFYVEFKNQNI